MIAARGSDLDVTGQAVRADLANRVHFEAVDAQRPLPFDDGFFDAVMCIDAINHLGQRDRMLAGERRLSRFAYLARRR